MFNLHYFLIPYFIRVQRKVCGMRRRGLERFILFNKSPYINASVRLVMLHAYNVLHVTATNEPSSSVPHPDLRVLSLLPNGIYGGGVV